MKAVIFGFAVAVASISAFGAFGACAAFDGDPPDKSCRTDNDCFRAQGEACDQDRHLCVCMNPTLGCVQEDAGMATSPAEEVPQ